MKSLVPDKVCRNEGTVALIGHDEAEVIETGKTYAADWRRYLLLKMIKLFMCRFLWIQW